MLKSVTVEEIDQLLDELEQLAIDSSRRKFYLAVLERLRLLLGANSTSFLVKTADDQWLPIARSGPVQVDLPTSFSVDHQASYWLSDDRTLLAVPLRKGDTSSTWRRGAIVVEFAVEPLASELDDLLKLCEAFAETIALRQARELETFLDRDWPAFQQTLLGIAAAQTIRGAAYLLVNDLVVMTSADRVTLVELTFSGPRVQAVSGTVELKRNAATVMQLQHLGEQAVSSGRPLVRYQASSSEQSKPTDGELGQSAILENYILLPIVPGDSKRAARCSTAVLLEWQEYDRFLMGNTVAQLVFPSLANAWLHHRRWLNIPGPLRSLFSSTNPRGRRASYQVLRMATLVVVIGLVLGALSLPTELRVEATGSLQPIEQRIVFAPLDGVVTRILVEDGQIVRQGEQLAELSSPMLNIELEEVAGELRANDEKLSGLKVAINQLVPEDPSAIALQNKFSSEIREIETRLLTLKEKQAALQQEKQKLTVLAPIDGSVIARQVERYLDHRPVRRGDPLLRVVRLDGPWRLELEVADRDAGRVKQQLFARDATSREAAAPLSGQVPDSPAAKVEFTYAATPNERWQADVAWVSESARNPLGDAAIVDVFANVPQETALRGHMGATVQANFRCGKHPFWFVWSRPLIEAIQRKMWF